MLHEEKFSEKTHLINGLWVKGSGPLFESHDPATGQVIWQGNAASLEEVNQSVVGAKEAFYEWSQLPLEKRTIYLNNFKEVLSTYQDECALAISQEVGKTLWDAKSEVIAMINKIDISLKSYQQRCATVIKTLEQIGKKSITRYKPHGVVSVFGPYNFPGHLPNGHIIPALLAGNSIIFKPSEYVPKFSILLMKYWEMASLPKGVLNMVQGNKETGKLLATHPKIDGLFFTGSLEAGQWLSHYYGGQIGKILALELGGNNPLVISDIHDVDVVVQLTILSSYITTGQRCTCARRLIVPEGSLGDQFIESLIEKIKNLSVGTYTDIPEPFMGPLISEQAVKKLLQEQETLQKQGGRALVKMHSLKAGTGFISPGLMDVTSISHRPDKEYFGPFLQLIRVPSFAAAIEEANNTCYGLTAGLCSDNPKEYEFFYQQVRAGVINWNTQLTGASSEAPFGGIGLSGNHRPSAFFAADYCCYPVASLEPI